MENIALAISDEQLPVTLSDARQILHERLLELVEAENLVHQRCSTTRMLRIEFSLEPIDVLSWLQAQPYAAKMYWSEREDDREVAGVGITDLITSYDSNFDITDVVNDLHTRLAIAEKGMRYYGGIRFQRRELASAAWQSFGAYRFVLPRFELLRQGAMTKLVCNIVLKKNQYLSFEDLINEVEKLVFESTMQEEDLRPLLTRTDLPDEPGWRNNIEAALDLFRTGTLHKIVLARKAIFSFDGKLNPITLLQRLKSTTPNSFHFCFALDQSQAFVGATPERLYQRIGRAIKSEAIAGTRPTGNRPEASERLGAELLASEKDQREHAYVRESIRDNLLPLCTSLSVAEQPTLLKQARRQHLLSPVEGCLADGVTDADVLRRLHPTPAVGGEPTDRALEEIARLEVFDRGWYAGPIGWVSADAAEFAVAIRSGLVQGSELALYSGAGIVAGSTPESEWDEIENKIGDFLKVLIGDNEQ
jgi:menaquinone-specific isochorismate synthase